MKKYLLIVFITAFGYCTLLDNTETSRSSGITRSISTTKTWQILGEEDFSGIKGKNSPLTVYEGIPYTAFIDEADGNRLSVMKYDIEGNEWLFLGERSFKSGAEEVSLSVDENGIYAVYVDEVVGRRFTVVKYNEVSDSWDYVGYKGVGALNIKNVSIERDAENIYVVYRTAQGKAQAQVFKNNSWSRLGSSSISTGNVKLNELYLKVDQTAQVPYTAYIDISNNSKVTVQKYEGRVWVDVGTAGFTPTKAVELSFTLDRSDNTPYILYTRPNGMETVMKYNGADWVIVGGADSPIDSEGLISLAVENGTVYTSYNNELAGLKASLVSYKTGWSFVGDMEVSSSAVKEISLAVEDGIPYLMYKNEIDNKVTVKKYTTLPSTNKAWQIVGEAGFSGETGGGVSQIITDSGGTPYIAFRKYLGIDYKAKVVKFNGSSWITAGQEAISSSSTGSRLSLITNTDGVFYIAFTDLAYRYKARVMKFDGSSWVNVGKAGFTPDAGHYISIAIDNEGTIFAVFQDTEEADKASVMSYNSSLNKWQYVGTPGFSSGIINWDTSIAIDSGGTPYAAFRDEQYGYKARVMKYNGSAWVDVGSPGFSAGEVHYISLQISLNDTLYLAYRDTGYNKAVVKKFNGTVWENVGTTALDSKGSVGHVSFTLDKDGVPYVSFTDSGRSGRVTMMRFNGTVWENIGTPGFTAENTSYNTLTVDNKGVPYSAYTGTHLEDYRITVMKYDVVPSSE